MRLKLSISFLLLVVLVCSGCIANLGGEDVAIRDSVIVEWSDEAFVTPGSDAEATQLGDWTAARDGNSVVLERWGSCDNECQRSQLIHMIDQGANKLPILVSAHETQIFPSDSLVIELRQGGVLIGQWDIDDAISGRVYGDLDFHFEYVFR